MAKINPVKLKQEAEKLEIAGRPDQAVILYRQILEDNPRDWNVINKIGDIYAKMNRAKEASEEYAKVADFYAKDGFLLKAIAIWKKINRLDASALEPYQNLAELYGKQGLLMEAKSQYQFVVDELIKRGRIREAGDVLKKMAEVDPGDLKIRSKLADLYTREGDPEKAVEEHVAIAEELNKKGHLAEALQVLERGLKIIPKSPRLRMELARVHLIQKNFDRASHYLEEAVQQNPDDPRLLIRLGEAYLGGKKIEEAEAIFKRLLELNPSDEEARVHMGRLCLLQENFDRAYDVFLPVVERLTGRHEGEKAAALLQMVVQKNPSHIKSLLKLVDVYRTSHKDMAVSATYSQLAEAYLNQGRFDEAASVLEVLLAREPYNQQLQTKLEFVKGRMSESGPAPLAAPSGEFMDEEFDLGRPEAAVRSALPPPPVAPQRPPAIEITGPLSDDDQEFVEEHLAEGRVFRKYGLVDKAADQFEAVVARFPDNIDARQELREIFKEKGDGAQAAEQCLALVEIFRLRGDEKAAAAQQEEAQRLQPKVAIAAPPAVAAPKRAVELGRAPSADALAPAEEEEEIALEAEEVALEGPGSDLRLEPSALEPFSLDEEAPFEGELVQQFLEDEPAVGPAEEVPLAPETGLWAPEGEDESPLSLALEKEVALEEASRVASLGATAAPPETAEREVPMALRRVLDEVDQYVALGFVEDAKEALQEIVARYPGHPAISSKMAELGIEVEPVHVPERGGTLGEYPPFEATLAADFEHPLEGLSTPEPEDVAGTGESIEGPGAEEELGIEFEASTLEIELEAPVEEETPFGDIGPEIPVLDVEPEAPPALAEVSARDAEPENEALVEEEIELPFVEEELASRVSEAPTGELEIALPSEELEEELEEEAPLAGETSFFEAETTGPESLLAESLHSGEELMEEESSLLDLEAVAETADVDLATELGELFGTQTAVQEPPPEAPGTELGDLGLADIFKEFKKGVDKQLSHEDYDTRYNLGIAYKEMGLLDEAIAEFQLAAKDEARLLECASMLGICFMEKGMPKLAIKWFERGLKAPGRREEEYSGLRYDLATAYEAAGDVQTAFNLYSELYGQDANFRDVAAKVRELRGAQASG